MSKRFGRNQRRTMRAELESTRATVDAMQLQRDRVIANQRPMRDTINRVASVLGKNFYGLPAVHHQVERIRDAYQAHNMAPSTALGLLDDAMAMSLVNHAVTQLTTHQARAARDALTGMVHVYLESRDDKTAYAISDSALGLATPEDLAYHVAPMIADAMTRCMFERGDK